MSIELKPGIYVLAISGGVDSMVLLDMAARLANDQKSKEKHRFIAAHFDHGIRMDSEKDRILVESVAFKHNLPFVYDRAELGPGASEATARAARYSFLDRVMRAANADAVVTAHHQDDLIETAIFNLMRGTGRKGLSSLGSTSKLKRPLLDFSKKQLIDYATRNHLEWRDDPTNLDTRYARNAIRHTIVSKMTAGQRRSLVKLLSSAKTANSAIDNQIAKILGSAIEQGKLDRSFFINLPHKIALEVMAGWLRDNNVRQFDTKTLERLVRGAKTLTAGKRANINKKHYLYIANKDISIKNAS